MEKPRAQSRPRSNGRRRRPPPSQLRSDRDGSFPRLVVDETTSFEDNVQASSTKETRTSDSIGTMIPNSNRRLGNDMAFLGRQIQRLNCAAPIACTCTERDSMNIKGYDAIVGGNFDPYHKLGSKGEIYQGDTLECNTSFHGPNMEAGMMVPGWKHLLAKPAVDAVAPSAQSVRAGIVSKSKELIETQSTDSCSEGDSYSIKNRYIPKPGPISRFTTNESVDYSTEGPTIGSSTDDGYDESTAKSRGGTATTTESTLTSFRKQNICLDGKDRIIRIPSIRLLDTSLLGQPVDCNENHISFTQNTSVFGTQGSIDLDQMLIFEDEEEFQGINQHETLNTTLTDDNTRIPGLQYSVPSRTSSPAEMRQLDADDNNSEYLYEDAGVEPVQAIPTAIQFDVNDSILEVRSSIDEDEIDNPEYLNFTYSPTGSFDCQEEQQMIDGAVSPGIHAAHRNVVNLQLDDSNILLDGEECINALGTANLVGDDLNCVQLIIADLKQLEEEEWFHSNCASHVIQMKDDRDATIVGTQNDRNAVDIFHSRSRVSQLKQKYVESVSRSIPQQRQRHSLPHASCLPLPDIERTIDSMSNISGTSRSSTRLRTRLDEFEQSSVSKSTASMPLIPRTDTSKTVGSEIRDCRATTTKIRDKGLAKQSHISETIPPLCPPLRLEHSTGKRDTSIGAFYPKDRVRKSSDFGLEVSEFQPSIRARPSTSFGDTSLSQDSLKQSSKGFFWRSHPSPTPERT